MPPGLAGQYLETELSKWETQQSQSIKKIIKKRTIKAVTLEEFNELIRFAVWLYVCNPVNREILRDAMSEFNLGKIRNLTGFELDKLSIKNFGLFLPHACIRKQLEEGAAKESLLQSEFLEIALEHSESVFNLVMEKYAWSLIDFKNFGSILCTSDRPVLLAGDTLQGPVGFDTSKVQLFFPLSPDLCLVGCNLGKEKKIIKNCHVVTDLAFKETIKILMWTKSNKFIIANAKGILPSVGIKLPSYIPRVLNSKGFLKFFIR